MRLANRIKKLVAVGIAIFLINCSLTGCRFTGYKGEHPALYTEAVNSLLGMRGYHSHGDSIIKIIDEDSFGRILFSYYDDSYFYGKISLHYLICQKIDETYVYYYPDYNFIVNEWNQLDVPFSEKEIEDLKNKNDWDKELDEEKFIKNEVVRMKKEPEVEIKRKDFDVLFRKISKDHGRISDESMIKPAVRYLTSDSYGRTLYYVSVAHKDISKKDMQYHLVIIFNPDGSYDESKCVMEFTNSYHYQDSLKEFKELNGWDQPLE